MIKQGPRNHRADRKGVGFVFRLGVIAVKELNAGRVQKHVCEFVPQDKHPLCPAKPVVDKDHAVAVAFDPEAVPGDGNLLDQDSRRRAQDPEICFGQHFDIPLRRRIPLQQLFSQTRSSLHREQRPFNHLVLLEKACVVLVAPRVRYLTGSLATIADQWVASRRDNLITGTCCDLRRFCCRSD